MSLINFTRVGAIAGRKFASLRRDKRMVGFIIIMPAIQILLFGIALGGTPTGLDVAVIDEGPAQLSTAVLAELNQSEPLVLHYDEASLESARSGVQEGEYWAVIHIRQDGTIELHLDNSNQQISQTIIIEVRDALTAVAEESGAQLPVEIAEPIYGDAAPAFIDFLAPGIMTMVCFMFSLILTTMAFVGERYDGTLDRVFAAGTRPMEVLLGHLLAFSTILVGQVTVVILIAVYGFDIPVNGSPLLLFAVGIFLGLAAMCMGLFVSSKAKSEFQAMQLNMPIMFPVMLLSGILWPVEALPTFIQPLSWALPSTWTAEAFRSIMVRGWGMSHSEVWIAFVFNLAFAAFALLLAARSLKARE